MEQETMFDPLKFKTGEEDVFILVLRPTEHSESKMLAEDINGYTSPEWVKKAVAKWHHRFVDTTDKDDVLSLFRGNITSAKFTIILYADTPLISSESIKDIISYVNAKNAKAIKLPRGFVFDTLYIKDNDSFDIYEYNLGNPDDYIIAWNKNQIERIKNIMNERKRQFEAENTASEKLEIPQNLEPIPQPDYYVDEGSTIGNNCKLFAGTRITNSIIGDGTIVNASQIDGSEIGKNCIIGPFANIRPGSKIADNVKIGTCVEVKKSTIGKGTKIAHMSYVGDGVVGKNCNIGCGVVFCNFDGKRKNQTVIGDNVFIGSNVNLIAPISIGNKAFVGAGSTITEDVHANALAIARARQYQREETK
ncbi:MAG: hypothetical protein LBH47_01635 [Christensenellaceae bacterium]|jgi:bifunctional N-acetylglucosamine-1-phosphate-uridyltransferase/glucosamine-1-phosphate-acetyltransferase GlmU-like protein|nr:hypothetical protein [Christensenellaceae bacterium]